MTKIGLQLYSLRDVTDKDLRGALKKVSEMGYKTVEFAGFFGHDAKTVKSWLDEYGLEAVGTHTGYKALEDDFDGVVAYHKAIGCENVIIPGISLKTMAEVDAFVEKSNKWNKDLAKEGLTLHYHNHDWEFLTMEEGFVPHDELQRRTDMLFEIDTYWVFVAGKDPLEVLDKLGDRVKVIHLKDGFADKKGKALGEGQAPVKAVLDKAIATGRKIVVESEGLDPTGYGEVGRCMDYLKRILK